jgi:peroxiredoxin
MKLSKALHIWVLSVAAAVGVGHAAASLLGGDAPDFVLKSLTGSNVRLSEYRGEIVMLSFWATWCGDCRSQLETLDEMRAMYGNAGIAVLAVSLDKEGRSADRMLQAMHLEYPVLHDAGGDVGRLYDVGSLPTTILIDRDGIVRGIYEGYRRGVERQYVDKAQELLREF